MIDRAELESIVKMAAETSDKVLTESERKHLIRMLERAAYRGIRTDALIEECKALMA